MNNSLISLFSGCGGLDLGFKWAGFNTLIANEYDKNIWQTYENNFTEVKLLKKSIKDIDIEALPKNINGLIGGPPCQSFSIAGAKKGIVDPRGQLFFEYIKILKKVQPDFFVAENVLGLLHERNKEALDLFLKEFKDVGYNVKYEIFKTNEYGIAQNRERVIFIGYKKEFNKKFTGIEKESPKTLRDVIWDLRDKPIYGRKGKEEKKDAYINGHEYLEGGFSSMYMSRNRRKTWDEQSFTILATGRQIVLHPDSAEMIKVEKDKYVFTNNNYRRLSIRECARIQSFPDSFMLEYDKVEDGYKMIGNAVPPYLAYKIASQIKQDLNY